jgi:PAS domain S-box-containing protein
VFWTWDARADRIIYVSPSYETVFGQSREELFRDSRSFHRMIDPEDLPHLMEVLADDPYTVAVEYRIVRADGQRRWVDVRTFPVRDADGEVARVVGIGRDITQLKTAEQTLLRSQRMESIGALAGGIAHDINNILTPILMAADVLSGMASTKAERDLTETIQQSAERGATMVRQVLSFARGVDGRHTTLELHRILSDLARLAHDTFDRRIAIDTRIDGALWPVAGDATQMHQVLLNLCVNARDAMPEGGVLRLTAVNSLIDRANAAPDEDVPDGRYVCITVADTGGGVAAAIRDRIFDPFFTTKPQGQGTGLGLPTAQAIVRSHGGVLSLASSAETGATFQILLPALRPQESISGELPAPELTRGNGEMVLVVDDEPAVRFVTRETLETFNYRVLLASNGTEAVPLLSDQQQPIALVVTDMMMPVLDGFGVIEAARRLRPALPIIAASGLDVDGMAARAVEAGARVFLSKPYTAHTLLQTVADVLAASNPAEAQ